MPRRALVAVLGGTFDHFHKGHEALLEAAFRAAPRVGVGITTDRFLRAQHKPYARSLEPYARRRATVRRFLARRYPRRRWWLAELDDVWGRSVEPGVDVLVASEETTAGARRVNSERRRRGLAPVRTVLVPLRRGEDGLPIAARRIRARTIDRDGRRLRPLRVAVVVAGTLPLAVARDALCRRYRPLELRVVARRGDRRGASDPRSFAGRLARAASARGEVGAGIVGPSPRGIVWVALADGEGAVGTRRADGAAGLARALALIHR